MDETDLGYDGGEDSLYEHDIYAQLRGARVWGSEQLELFREAYQKGMGGGGGLITLLGNTPIVSVNMPPENAVRSWQVTLLAMQAPSLTGVAIPAVADAPAAGQFGLDGIRPLVHTRDDGARNGAFKVRLEYGTHNSMERAWLDYPYGGSTFEIGAAYLRIFVEAPAAFAAGFLGQPFPVVGAYVTPCDRSKASTFPPTYTQATRLVPAAAALAFYMPPRAFSYRVFTFETAAQWGAATTLSTFQAFQNGSPVRQDFVNVTPWATTQGNGGQDWVLCDPSAVSVFVSHSDAVSAHNLGVQFTLDLG